MQKLNNEVFCCDLWDVNKANAMSEAELLLYRSNLLGSDKRITNFGGGNTSAKLTEIDILTNSPTEVLWVKGSGGDLGSMKINGFSTLYMEKLAHLKSHFENSNNEDDMVTLLSHCTYNLNPRAASIDTSLHAFLPHRHVDHMHPDSIIAIAASKDGREITKSIFQETIGWLSWRRPGFVLGLELEQFARNNPQAKGVILENHGLFTWEESSYTCYRLTLDIINQAQTWLDNEMHGKVIFGGNKVKPSEAAERLKVIENLMPQIRGLISTDEYLVGEFVDNDNILEFLNSNKFAELASLGTSCPDHFLRTKIWPLVVDLNFNNLSSAQPYEDLNHLINDYRVKYQDYYDRCKHDNSPAIRNPNPVIFLIPGIGMISFAKNKATARISAEFYENAINVMRIADTVSEYVGLIEQEAFDIEYWLLEEAKLQRLPKPRPLVGQVAIVTGAAGGIGKATARKLVTAGASVVLTDIDEVSLQEVTQILAKEFDQDVVRSFTADITSEANVVSALNYCCSEYGGIDILISNAGIASSSPIEETSLEMWQKNMDILSTGYFLISRETFKVFQKQKLNGAVVFIASKNGLVASPNASAYCTAKAAEIQLARTLALEGAAMGIRVNVVNPDAVLQDSKIWSGDWKKERADAYQMDPDDLQEYYRNRSLLKENVYPEDIANAAYFLVTDQSKKSTGNIINVDAGHAPSFTR